MNMLKNVWEKKKRLILLILGLFFVMLAIIGIALPLLPTTPFLLVAAFCFSKSSERLHRWLREHKLAGPLIKNWEDRGAISPRSKFFAIMMLMVSMSYPLFKLSIPIPLKCAIAVVGLSISLFIVSRPSS